MQFGGFVFSPLSSICCVTTAKLLSLSDLSFSIDQTNHPYNYLLTHVLPEEI
jgi:hypothetical protein